MDHCFGCAPCITGLQAKGYNVVALVSCGGPPGNAIGAKLNAINLWVMAHNPGLLPITPVYGGCIDKCGECKPKMGELIKSATKKEIVEFVHPYSPKQLFEKI